MLSQSQFDQVADRIERLLLRHQELQRTNALLGAQLNSVTVERVDGGELDTRVAE